MDKVRILILLLLGVSAIAALTASLSALATPVGYAQAPDQPLAPAACVALAGPGQIPAPTVVTFDELPAGTSTATSTSAPTASPSRRAARAGSGNNWWLCRGQLAATRPKRQDDA